MAILDLVLFPDARLKTKCNEITTFDDNIKTEILNMLESMEHYKGIGLAACQVGIMKQIFVMNHDVNSIKGEYFETKIDNLGYYFINPVILESSFEISEYEEGCLSFPDQRVIIERPETISIRFQDIKGGFHEIKATKLAAICIQHEMDHLNGIVMPDRVKSIFKRNNIITKAKKIKSEIK